MKTFNLTMVVSSSQENLTEEEMMIRFESFLTSIPKDIKRKIFQLDCCIIELKVEEKQNDI